MSPRDQFQMYLLTKMSAADRVADALARLGLSEAQMRAGARGAAALDETVRMASTYEQLIGPPTSERPARPDEARGSFAGSIRRAYSLPLWPDVEFVVYQHPEGWAWGEQFEQPPDWALPTDPAQIEPWRWTRARLSAAAHVEILDEWSWDCEALLRFDSGVVYRARFDYGLLQSWTIEG